MINYNDDDWFILTKETELSECEQYFVYDVEFKINRGVCTFIDGALDNEGITIYIDEIEGGEFYLMEFDYPMPPRCLSENSEVF